MTDSKKKKEFILPPNVVKEVARRTDKINLQWELDWAWLPEEYVKLQKALKEISENAPNYNRKPSIIQDRTIKPVPNSTNHEYGWICTRPEFRLEHGPDVYKYPEFQEDYSDV